MPAELIDSFTISFVGLLVAKLEACHFQIPSRRTRRIRLV